MKHIFEFNFKLLVTLIWLKYGVSVTYVPPNRIIEAVQNDRYVFGLDYEYGIRGCRVTSDTGILHSFLIRPPYGTAHDTNDSSAAENIVSDRGHEGLCQVIVRNVQDNGPKRWDLEAMDYDNEIVLKTSFTVELHFPDYPKHLNVTTKVGEPFTVSCNVPYNSNYCRIRAPNGTVFKPDNTREVSLGRCSLHVQQSSFTENGTWTCSYGRKTGTPDDVILVDVIIAEVLRHDKVVEVDVGHSAEFMCRSSVPLEYCRFMSPDGVGYSIGNHENNPSGIGYLGKGFEYGECGMRIPKVQACDKGYWTCVTKLVKDDGEDLSKELSAKILLNVKTPIINGAAYPKIINLPAKLSQSLTINCEVSYSTDYWHILSPMGTKYLPNKPEELDLGRCTFHIASASSSDQGAWTCVFARETGFPDEKIIVNVSFNEPLRPTHISEVMIKESGTARLMCKMADVPLGYCRFNSPSAESYHIRDKDSSSSTRIKYYGKGLKYGECGIEISNVTLSDSGKWTCVFQPLPDGYEERSITLVVIQSEDVVSK